MRSGSVVAKQQLEVINLLESNFSSSYQQAFSKPNLLPQFSFNAISRLADIQAQINEGSDIYNLNYVTGGNQLLSNKQYRRNLKQAQEVIDEEGLQAAHALTSEIKSDNDKKHYLTFLHRLREANTWKAIVEKAESHQLKAVRHLKREWKKAGNYAHFTLNALFNAIELLSRLAELIGLALQELEYYKKKIELAAYDQYLAYLQNYKAIIKKQQKHIANNLFYRVELAFIHQDETKHDFTQHLISRFHLLGLIRPSFLTDMQAIQSESVAINFPLALTFILKHSTVREAKIEKQSRLPSYFGLASRMKSKLIDGEFCLIPEALLTYVPHKRPAWIFRGQRARYQFLKNKTDFLKYFISIRYNQQQVPSIEDLLSHSKWNTLNELNKQINVLKNEATQLKKKSSSIFSRKSRQFYQVWESLLVDKGCFVLKEQIDLLEKVAKQPASINELFSKPSINAEINQKIIFALDSLEQNSMFSQLRNEDQIRFKEIKNQILVKCHQNGKLEAVEIGLAELAGNRLLNNNDFDELFQFLFGISEKKLKKFYTHHQEKLISIFSSIETLLKEGGNALVSLSADRLTLITQQIKMVEVFAQLEEVNEGILPLQFEPVLDKFIDQYKFYLYSSTISSLNEKQDLLLKLEETISLLLVLHPNWKAKLEKFISLTHDRQSLQNGKSPVRGESLLAKAKMEYEEGSMRLEAERKLRQSEMVKLRLNEPRLSQQPTLFYYHPRRRDENVAELIERCKLAHQAAQQDLQEIDDQYESIANALATLSTTTTLDDTSHLPSFNH